MAWNNEHPRAPTGAARRNARVLRRRMTDSEKRLWWHLRHRLALEGTHFRRQVAIGPYVVDFGCLTHRLVIEVDGGGHSRDERLAADAARDAALAARGWRVLRFTNSDVVHAIDNVLDTIFAATAETAAAPSSLEA